MNTQAETVQKQLATLTSQMFNKYYDSSTNAQSSSESSR